MGFLHPWLLLLGLGIVIPIAIHLFNFHRFKRVLFTNVKFLKSIATENKKQNKLLRRLLLLFRCLTILLLAFLFSGPYIKDSQNQLVKEGGNAVVLIVDNSFSMQNNASKGSLLENAKLKVEQILKQYSDNDVFCLLTMDLEGRHKHFVEKKTLRELLKDVQVSSNSVPYSELINTAHRLLNLRNENSKRVFMISDFQVRSFDKENFKQDSLIRDVFLCVKTQNLSNVYVDSIMMDKNIFLKGQKVDMVVRVTNCSKDDVEKQTVKLFIDNEQQSLATSDIKANSSIDIPMSFVLKKSGNICGKVSLIDSPITYDDDFYFTLNVENKIKVLSINGSAENKYLDRLFRNSSEIELDNMSANNIDFSLFSQYSTIILNELNSLPSGLTNELKNYRQKGVSLVVIPSENIDIASYNAAMQTLQMPLWDKLIKEERKVKTIDTKNNIFKNVFSSITDNMQMPTCKQYYRLRSGGNVSQQEIMTMVNDDAFFVQNTINTSNAYIFTTPFSDKWTDFVNQSIFVPIMWNIALYSTVLPPIYLFTNYKDLVDISILLPNKNSEYISLVKQGTQNSIIPQMQYVKGRYGFFLQSQIHQDGFYDILDKDSVLGVLAMNYPREESDLTFLSSNEINKQLKSINYNNFSVFNDRKLIQSYFAQSQRGFNFTLLLLILITISLALESIVAKKLNS